MQWTDFQFFVRKHPADQIERIHRAYLLGERKHAGQIRKSGEEYFSHPVAVAAYLAELKADPDTIVAALLHDTVEDTDLTLKEIDEQFDGTVASLIEGVTKLSKEELAEKPTLDRQIETLRKIFTLMQDDIRIMVIKLYDRLHNMQTVSFLSEKSQKMLAEETFEVYVKIADRLCMQDMRDELGGLCRAVLEPESFTSLYHLKRQNRQTGRQKVAKIRDTITHSNFKHILQKVSLRFENKTWKQLMAQMETEGAISGNADIVCAFVCDSLDTCYQTLGMLHQLWLRESMSFQDFINAPAINGYRGLHTTIILEDGTRVRCKIRTKEMHDYARRGIATVCFQENERANLDKYLPWTKRISPLSADTEGRSDDFWENLKRDILGESIIIHGPADQRVLIPKESTALDAVFFLFNDDALKLESVKVNGKTVPFSTPLTYGVTLDVTLADEPTVRREWLMWTATGMATAGIRGALLRYQTNEEKMKIGKELLQKILTDKRRGFIDEFDEQTLLQQTTYNSFNDIYIAIANGILKPLDAYDLLFERQKDMSKNQHACVVNYTMNMNDESVMQRIRNVYKKYDADLREMRIKRQPNTPFASVTSRLQLAPANAEHLREDLQEAGAEHVEVIIRMKREIVLMAGVILPWAINPVFAKWLILSGLRPLSLITVRFLVFSVFMTVFFCAWRCIKKPTFSPIPKLPLLATIPAITHAIMTAFTYLSIAIIPPSVHLTILRFNTLLLRNVSLTGNRPRMRRSVELFIGLLSLTALLFILTLGKQYAFGIGLGILALFSYTIYSLSTEHVLQANQIKLRQPFLMFYMGIFLGLIGLLLLPFQHLKDILNPLTLPAIFYILLCVCLPHTSYAALLKRTRFKHFTDLLLLETPIAIALETSLLAIHLPIATYFVIAAALVTLFVIRWNRIVEPLH